ncbi:MAG: flavodoxin family protein [Desulfatibacillaceae bacterium]
MDRRGHGRGSPAGSRGRPGTVTPSPRADPSPIERRRPMNMVTLLGTPRGEAGNTARLLSHVLRGARSEGAANETVVLKGDSILPCRGCDLCHKKGYCPQEHRDEFTAVEERIYAADGVILASPNYIFSVSARLRAFMDRCAASRTSWASRVNTVCPWSRPAAGTSLPSART